MREDVASECSLSMRGQTRASLRSGPNRGATIISSRRDRPREEKVVPTLNRSYGTFDWASLKRGTAKLWLSERPLLRTAESYLGLLGSSFSTMAELIRAICVADHSLDTLCVIPSSIVLAASSIHGAYARICTVSKGEVRACCEFQCVVGNREGQNDFLFGLFFWLHCECGPLAPMKGKGSPSRKDD